jgi:hypothetical protein
MARLPVSGMEVRFRTPDGNDDLAMLEAGGSVMERALMALDRLAEVDGGAAAEAQGAGPAWPELTVTDFEVALLRLRRFLFGDSVSCLFRCPAEGCGERMEPEFSISELLEDVQPTLPKQVTRAAEGWFSLPSGDVRFRLPTVCDQVSVADEPRGYEELASRCVGCIEGKSLNARAMAQVERAMAAMAPRVSRVLDGTCPACGAALKMLLYVPELVMNELRLAAAGVHEEIHAIAGAYHWDERTILDMPQVRRRAYVETIQQHAKVAV